MDVLSPMLSAASTSVMSWAATESSVSLDTGGVNVTTPAAANDSSLLPSSECLELPQLQQMDFLPWDNPDNLLSAETEQLVSRLGTVVVLPILFLMGGPANVVNMAVFYRQGLTERINVCLFALSLSDGLYLLYNVVLYGEQLWSPFNSGDR